MDVSAPAWLDRAITVKEPGMDRTVLAKQLGLIELTPVPVDGFDGISDENPNARDVIVVGKPKDGEDRFAIAAALKVQLKAAASKSNKAIPVSFVLVDEQMVYFQQMPFVCMCICMARPICLLVLNEETRTLLATRLVGM